MSCVLNVKPPAAPSRKKSIDRENTVVDGRSFNKTEKENNAELKSPVDDIPFPASSPAKHDVLPVVRAITEEKAEDNGKFDAPLKENFLNLSFVSKSSNLVTVMKYHKGEFVSVKSPSTYNSSISFGDMKKALTEALDTCIDQSNVEVPSAEPTIPHVEMGPAPVVVNPSPKKTPSNVNLGQANLGDNVNKTKHTHILPQGGKVSDDVTNKAPPKKIDKRAPRKPKQVRQMRKERHTEVSMTKAPLTKETAGTAAVPNAKVKTDKPQQVRVKKLKIPHEESIKFANRQREIQQMKRELKERLRREGKNGIDPVTRMNAWGRTVGVTCTLCGHHVQKSYGCFKRETAPAKLLHLFSPGMNRIKICRRCLPYKKQAIKIDIENKTSNSAVVDPRCLNKGKGDPKVEGSVSSTTLKAIHRKVTSPETAAQNTATNVLSSLAGDVGLGHVNSGAVHVLLQPGLVNLTSRQTGLVNMMENVSNNPSHVNISSGLVNIPVGHVNTPTGMIVLTSTGNESNLSGHVNTIASHVKSGIVQVSPVDPMSSGDQTNADLKHVSPASFHVTNNTVAREQLVQGEKMRMEGMASEYIKKLALNLKKNQNKESEPTVNVVSPEDMNTKTAMLNQDKTFTPLTALINNVNNIQGSNEPAHNVNKPAESANEATRSFQQVASTINNDEKMTAQQPLTTIPLLLKTQPQFVLTSPAQNNSNMSSMPTTVSPGNQSEVKVLPALMVPSSNTLPQNSPVFLQIQHVKVMTDKTSGIETPVGNMEHTSEQEKDKPNATVEQVTSDVIICGKLPTDTVTSGVSLAVSHDVPYVNDISSDQVRFPAANLPTLAHEIQSSQVETPTVDLRSISGDILSSQVETSPGDIKKITEEIASLIENSRTCAQGNFVDTNEHMRTQENTIEPMQSNEMQTSNFDNGLLQNNENLEQGILRGGDLISYQPTNAGSGSAVDAHQDTTTVAKDIGSGQVSTRVKDVSDVQVPEGTVFLNVGQNLSENLREVQEKVHDEKESLQDGGKGASHESGGILDGTIKIMLLQNNAGSSSKTDLKRGNVDNHVTLDVQQPIVSAERSVGTEARKVKDDEVLDEINDDCPSQILNGDVDTSFKDKDGVHVTTFATTDAEGNESREKVNDEILNDTAQTCDDTLTKSDEQHKPCDIRRSRRRTTSPRKFGPTKVYGTRKQTQITALGTTGDKVGHQSSFKGKNEQLGAQKKDGQGNQKDGNESTQGVKRKRQARSGKNSKVGKSETS